MEGASHPASAVAPRGASAGAPPGRDPVIERMLGNTGEPDRILLAAESMANRALGPIAEALSPRFSFMPELSVQAVDLVRIADAAPSANGLDLMVTAGGAASPDALTLMCSADAISILTQATFGGDRDVAAYPLQRGLSAIERQLAAYLFDAAARALNGSGARGLDISFPLPEPQPAAETAKNLRDGPAARIVFRLAIGSFAGFVTALVPQRVLVERRTDDAVAANPGQWRARLSDGLMRSNVRLEATIPLPKVKLGEVAVWQVGDVIEFPMDAHADTRLSARNKALFLCEFGRLGDHFTVRIKNPLDATQDFIDGLARR